MSNAVTQFTGSIPDYYDRCLGPHIFVPYARDMALRVAALAPRHVLEIAAGTGIVSKCLRATLPTDTELLISDLNQPMLEIAKTKLAGASGVSFQAADACVMPFPDEAFDCAVCQFGMMFFPDKERHLRETRDVLRQGGHYLFNVWAEFACNPFARIAHETIGNFFTSDPPGFYKVPFGYHDIATIKDALTVAGFGDISADVVKLESRVPDARLFAEGLVLGNPVVEEIKARGTARVEDVVSAVSEALRREFGEPGVMPVQAIVFSATKA